MAENSDSKFSNTSTSSNDKNSHSDSPNKINPPPEVSHVPLSSSPSTFILKNYNEFCIPDEDLPSKNIAELWQKPLKLTAPTPVNSDSPKAKHSGRKKRSQRTPSSRRNFLPPTKLLFDSTADSNEQNTFSRPSRLGLRRSMSTPEATCCEGSENEALLSSSSKRMKRLVEEDSPYDDFVNTKSALIDSNGNGRSASSSLTPAVKKLFLKSQSDSVLSSSIKTALDKIEGDPTLIGDASTSYILPFKHDGKHPDLKEITGETLAKLLEEKEDFPGVVFKVIDCRYPYEFDGGHIRGALNLYTKKQIQEELLDCKLALKSPSSKQENNSREILIFHCEFSSRRGPILCRYLRDIDRTSNTYPFLFYPELYVLYGGYKDFFEEFPYLCDPMAYVPMSHSEHADLYRKYKSESKLGL